MRLISLTGVGVRLLLIGIHRLLLLAVLVLAGIQPLLIGIPLLFLLVRIHVLLAVPLAGTRLLLAVLLLVRIHVLLARVLGIRARVRILIGHALLLATTHDATPRVIILGEVSRLQCYYDAREVGHVAVGLVGNALHEMCHRLARGLCSFLPGNRTVDVVWGDWNRGRLCPERYRYGCGLSPGRDPLINERRLSTMKPSICGCMAEVASTTIINQCFDALPVRTEDLSGEWCPGGRLEPRRT